MSGRPYDCTRCERTPGLKERLGCDSPRETPYRIGPERVEIYRCPMSMVARPGREALTMSRAAQDHQAGVLSDWPRRYSARFEEGVRLLISQRARCHSHLMESRSERAKRR